MRHRFVFLESCLDKTPIFLGPFWAPWELMGNHEGLMVVMVAYLLKKEATMKKYIASLGKTKEFDDFMKKESLQEVT